MISKKRILKSILEISAVVGLILVLFFAISWLMGLFNPITVNKYILTNGDKIVVFQEMRHVGNGHFYQEIDNDTLLYRNEGYILMYEGIFDFLSPIEYENIQVNYIDDIMEQPILIGGYNSKDINLDLNWFYIIDNFNKKINEENKKNETDKNYIKKTINDLPIIKSQKDKKTIDIVRYTKDNLYSIRFVENIKKDYSIDINKFIHTDNTIENSVLLTERNKLVFDKITTTTEKRMLIHYGSDHFEGIYELLKNSNQNWTIIDTEIIDVL